MKKWLCLLIALLMTFTLFITSACAGGTDPGQGPDITGPDKPGDGGDPGEEEKPDPSKVIYAKDYTPDTFSADSLTYTITHLGDGVRMVKNSYTLDRGSGRAVVVYATEIDLTKAEIHAGGSNGTKKTPYAQMTDWEAANAGQKVLLATNADFFNPGTGVLVNAFVQNGVIVKDSHNDNGSYDYKNTDSDLPASAPVLFGIKGGAAQIAPMKKYTGDITSASVKEGVVKSKLYYTGILSGSTVRHKVKVNGVPYSDDQNLLYLTDSQGAFLTRRQSTVVKIKLSDGKVTEVKVLDSQITLVPEEGFALLVAHPDYAKISSVKSAKVGDTFSTEVTSEDGTWNGYETVIGCRQELVRSGAVAATVKLENSNGAQSTDIPRTAVGMKKDGTVVLFSVEALRYGKTSTSDADPYGLNLSELADFIRYYDCQNAANFDGGGSTQVVVREGLNGSGDPKVIVRSSDTGLDGLTKTRAVVNTFLITTKKP